jgi:hypothetical protein
MAGEDSGKGPTPPYTSFPSFKTLIATLKENGLPGRIDRSMLKNFSGGVAGQLLTALRFMGLTDDAGHPTDDLTALVGSYGTDAWPSALASVLQMAYAPLFQLRLESASPAQFNDLFRKAFAAEGDTFRKCVTFFLSAAKEAQVPISSYIMQNKKPRLGPTKKRAPKVDAKPKPPAPAKDDHVGSGSDHTHHQPAKEQPPEQVLLALLDPESMSADEQQAVWTLLLYLKKKPSSGGSS